jgi:hypothetical protein
MVAFENVKNHYVQIIVYFEAFSQQFANFQGCGCLSIFQTLGFLQQLVNFKGHDYLLILKFFEEDKSLFDVCLTMTKTGFISSSNIDQGIEMPNTNNHVFTWSGNM